jgi:DNA-binding transcriptional MerR regulator
MEQVVAIGEFSQLSGIGELALRRLCNKNKIRHKIVGGGFRIFDIADIEIIRDVARQEGIRVFDRSAPQILTPMA